MNKSRRRYHESILQAKGLGKKIRRPLAKLLARGHSLLVALEKLGAVIQNSGKDWSEWVYKKVTLRIHRDILVG